MMQVEHFNPDGLHRNPAFTQVVAVTAPAKTIYVGGQDALDAAGNIVGAGDIAAQAEQVLRNLEAALRAAGAELKDVVKWNVYVVQGQPLMKAFEAFQRLGPRLVQPPAITVVVVAGLANPDFLLEMDAVAVVG